MGRLTYPIVDDGLIAVALVNLELPALAPRMIAGTAPAAIATRAILDTGSDITCVRSTLLKQLGVPVMLSTKTESIGGTHEVELYRVSLHLVDANNPQSQWISTPALTVMGLKDGLPIDAIIGMDVLRDCVTTIDGPNKHFTIQG